mgnify:CR=1 FL=1
MSKHVVGTDNDGEGGWVAERMNDWCFLVVFLGGLLFDGWVMAVMCYVIAVACCVLLISLSLFFLSSDCPRCSHKT